MHYVLHRPQQIVDCRKLWRALSLPPIPQRPQPLGYTAASWVGYTPSRETQQCVPRCCGLSRRESPTLSSILSTSSVLIFIATSLSLSRLLDGFVRMTATRGHMTAW